MTDPTTDTITCCLRCSYAPVDTDGRLGPADELCGACLDQLHTEGRDATPEWYIAYCNRITEEGAREAAWF